MAELAPRKRRRIASRPSAAHIQAYLCAPKMTASWPSSVVPLEIFGIIISFLDRRTVQNMRLVNHEFEQKVSGELFKTVVVPFRPEIYGIAGEFVESGSDVTLDGQSDMLASTAAIMLQDKGLRVFQGYGGHIHKFAMSFEFDYDTLMAPPTKSDQEAITTFWGIYRWPFKKYKRYAQIEDLEHTADETRTMAKALRYIDQVKELGLSVDGALGWLPGPDFNVKVQDNFQKVAVFGSSRFMPADKKIPAKLNLLKRPVSNKYPLTEANQSWLQGEETHRLTVLEQMLREAGYEGQALSKSVKTLIESEGYAQPSPDDTAGESCSSSDSQTEYVVRNNDYEVPHLNRLQSFPHHAPTPRQVANRVRIANTGNEADGNAYTYPLKPNSLTTAQKEILLETEWAQRAFMQSYVIAVIDNSIAFQNVTTLTIARLPARHLPNLRRADFWASLSNLSKLSLAVIPDWRDVTKLPTSWVEDIRVSPSQSICGVYQLLKDNIAMRQSIKTIDFEWLCGGEEATGIFSRNQHILAAPLLPQALDMMTRVHQATSLLSLPHVEHLTLKNCWISPHVLIQFTKTLKLYALQSLTLDSVSLSAPATQNLQPGPVNLQIHHHQPTAQAIVHTMGNLLHHIGPFVPTVFTTLHAGPQIGLQQSQVSNSIQPSVGPSGWLDQPRFGSWAHFIDVVTPGPTLANQRFDQEIGPVPSNRVASQLIKIVFNSCGYIRLQLDLDQSMLEHPDLPPGDTHYILKRRNELESLMMKPQEHTLGTIINYIDYSEAKILTDAWNLRIGWCTARKALALQAMADGIRMPGQGRFGGTIVANDSGSE